MRLPETSGGRFRAYIAVALVLLTPALGPIVVEGDFRAGLNAVATLVLPPLLVVVVIRSATS